MEISLICTVYNEGESIRDLLDSIVNQTRTPDEAVFVDADSTDNTKDIVKEYQEDHDWIRLIVDEGCNIAEGRNTAVESAEYDYIVGTDGGCIVDEEWCEAMEEAFQEGYEALSGLWKPYSKNLFEFVQGEIRGHYIESGNIPENWAPSSRSIGFTRQAWREAGKYPEHLYTGEDAKYNSNMRRAGYEWHVVEDAWVEWKMRPTWKTYWKQFRQYGEGDARAGNMFDYPGKIIGVSKVFIRTFTTWLAILGLALALYDPRLLILTLVGLGPQYANKLPSLISSVRQRGLRAALYWLTMIPMESLAHFYGYYKERLGQIKP